MGLVIFREAGIPSWVPFLVYVCGNRAKPLASSWYSLRGLASESTDVVFLKRVWGSMALLGLHVGGPLGIHSLELFPFSHTLRHCRGHS